MLLKTRLRCQCLLNPRHSLHAYSLFNKEAGRRLVQRFPNLAWLEDLSLQEQGLFLLSRIVDGFGHVCRFWKGGLSWCMDGIDVRCVVPAVELSDLRSRLKSFHPPQFFKRLHKGSPEFLLLRSHLA
jgi:hypothetical protein